MGPQIARLARAVERPAAFRPGVIDAAASLGREVGAAIVHERQDRPVIERDAAMAGAAGAVAGSAGQVYQSRRTNPAAVDVDLEMVAPGAREREMMPPV